jgi:hypothetical protein
MGFGRCGERVAKVFGLVKHEHHPDVPKAQKVRKGVAHVRRWRQLDACAVLPRGAVYPGLPGRLAFVAQRAANIANGLEAKLHTGSVANSASNGYGGKEGSLQCRCPNRGNLRATEGAPKA